MKHLDGCLLRDLVLAALPGQCVAVVDLELRYHLIAGPLLLQLGTAPEEVLGRTIIEVLHEKDLGAMLEHYRTALAGVEVTFEREYNGVYLEQAIVPLYEPAEGRLVGAASITRDISHRVRNAQSLQTLSITDPLTQLSNRRGLAIALRDLRPGTTLLVLDLDGFKRLNDSQGHAAGDAVLVTVAEAMRRCTRPSDVLARTGGDEFAVLLREAPASQAAHVADRIRAAVAVGGHVTVSIGMASCPEDTNDAAALRDLADARMYLAKRARRGG